MTKGAAEIARIYRAIYGKAHIETGPRLVSKGRKYVSRKRLFAEAEPYLAGIAFDGHHHIIEVPSAWHALCVAMRLQDDMLNERQKHLVFRGQSNHAYKLIASIYRPGADAALLDRAKKLMAWYLASNAGLTAADDPVLFYGAAQHYQIWTNLLDITPDPAVAVWFASLPAGPSSQGAAVYCFPLEHAEELGLNMRLPPPFITRLYRQRGLFIECASAAPLPMNGMIEIRFPAMGNTNKPFQVIRGPTPQDLLQDDTWIRAVVQWAKDTAATDVAIPDSIPKDLGPALALFLKGVGAAGIKPALLSAKQKQRYLLRWADQFNDLLYWCAYRFDDATDNAEEVLEPKHVARIVRPNRQLARLYVQLGRTIGTHHGAAFNQQLDLIDSVLAE
jgi:hypothetical protein